MNRTCDASVCHLGTTLTLCYKFYQTQLPVQADKTLH